MATNKNDGDIADAANDKGGDQLSQRVKDLGFGQCVKCNSLCEHGKDFCDLCTELGFSATGKKSKLNNK